MTSNEVKPVIIISAPFSMTSSRAEHFRQLFIKQMHEGLIVLPSGFTAQITTETDIKFSEEVQHDN